MNLNDLTIKLLSKFITVGTCMRIIDYKLKHLDLKSMVMNENVKLSFDIKDKEPAKKKTKKKAK